jgi:glutaredoxin
MSFKTCLSAACLGVVLASTLSLSHAQSLGDRLKLVPKSNSASNLMGAIQSLSDITQGRVDPGAGPENAEGKVILYRTASCPFCKRAAAYMQSRNVGYVERDIERNPEYKAEFSRLHGKGVPLMVFRDVTLSGFDEASFERHYADFKRGADAPASPAAALAGDASAGRAIQSGDVLVGKIGGVNVYGQPAKSGKSTVLAKGDEVIYMGEDRDGFYRVTTQKGEGWVDKLLMKKQ